jgi:hypothetical protein
MNIQNAEDYHLWLKPIDGCAFYGSDKTLNYRVQ